MATVTGPILRERGCIEEENGAVKRFVCHYTVKDCAGATLGARMLDALNALTTFGVVFGYQSPTFPDLMITNRNLLWMPGDNENFTAEVIALNYADLEGQGIFSSSSSMTSATTNVDFVGNPITVAYQFPAGYATWFPNCAAWEGQIMTQGVTLQTLLPTDELTATKLLNAAYPTYYSDTWKGHLNQTTWRGRVRGSVMCTNVSFKPVRRHKAGDLPGHMHLFQFSFQWLGRGHQPRVQFTDPNTGAPPPDLLYGTGYYQMDGYQKPLCYWFPYREFNDLFPGGS